MRHLGGGREGPVATRRPRILVVDDLVDAQEALCMLLEMAGYLATGVSSGIGALTRLENDAFDVLIVDIDIEHFDGLEVVRAARARPERPVVLAFTGYHALKHAADVDGCDAVILKPQVDKLLSSLGALLAERRAVVELQGHAARGGGFGRRGA
jgi:two-component system copper resistance phosphate regulon response regulator CusR